MLLHLEFVKYLFVFLTKKYPLSFSFTTNEVDFIRKNTLLYIIHFQKPTTFDSKFKYRQIISRKTKCFHSIILLQNK